jgi:hypothetical protein
VVKKTPLSKKRRGPAPTGVGTPQLVRIHDRQLAEIDAWAVRQDDKISRPEAIRRLVEIGLKARTPPNKVSIEFYPMKRAAELAVQAIDEMIDCNAPPEERDRRRLRLTKGPSEFREYRVDQPK